MPPNHWRRSSLLSAAPGSPESERSLVFDSKILALQQQYWYERETALVEIVYYLKKLLTKLEEYQTKVKTWKLYMMPLPLLVNQLRRTMISRCELWVCMKYYYCPPLEYVKYFDV
ncbi:hypothetical protein U1Q18_035651 [Sarracenia purpurea var. burkii]